MQRLAPRLLVIGLVLLLIAGGYLAYGQTGAVAVVGAISVALFAIWVYRTS
jgi:hypothetical protein